MVILDITLLVLRYWNAVNIIVYSINQCETDFSAGIGRTGTFLAVDYLLEQAKAEGVVDVVKYTYLMRSNRINMIQTPVSFGI